jgi:DNA-binding transcriptional MerR regulator
VTITLPTATGFTLKRVQQMLGLSRTVVSGLVAAGFVTPERGPRNVQRFSFQDLLLLRTAHALQRADIPPRKIVRALTRLSKTLPDELPLTGLRITAVGAEVAVHDRGGQWNPDTGQVLMDFDVAPAGSEVAFLQRQAPSNPTQTEDADTWFRRGEDAEAHDMDDAERAYRQAIALDEGHGHAHLNLGALLCEAGRCDEAVALYEQAVGRGISLPLLHFNHAIALEDLGLHHEALASYERALELDPGLLDAHYNAGCLMEKMGDSQGALRHFSTYRRLSKA